MKCEHCYHGKVCKGSGVEIVADECEHFRDAKKVIELPCKVGDTVYFIKSCFFYAKSSMQGTVCMIRTFSESNTFTFGVIMESSSQERSFTNFDIGKTVFLTPEAAQKALEEGAK